ncbi:MAG: hypothetical protein RLZZ142_1371 [Verrucomicrobiota bacterium]
MESGARMEVNAVLLDGEEARVPKGRALQVPNGTRDLEIRFGSMPSGEEAARVRYRIEGFDADWQDPPAHMRAVVHFVDAEGLEVGASHTLMRGTSQGWRGRVEDAAFDLRTLETVAPSRAERAYLEFVSGGTDPVLGVYALSDVQLEVLGTDGQRRRSEFPVSAGVDLGDRLGVPEGWRRGGSKPEMALVEPLPGGAGRLALVLRDSSEHAYCIWQMPLAKGVFVRAGERLRVQWRECYSIGSAAPAVATYRFLRPGMYRFQMVATRPSGEPLGRVVEMQLVVQSPLWQRPWIWLLGAGGAVGGVALAVRRVTRQRMQRKLAELQRERALESERARIAQDIHDELGAGLAQIAMLSELAHMDSPGDALHRTQLEEIGARAHAAGRKLDEIVWAINPEHDSAEDLVGYLARFAQDYLSLARIRFRLDVPPALPEVGLSSRQRHQIFLAAKEAIHNAVKHGSARQVTLRVGVSAEELVLTVSDDGCGFADSPELGENRGSANMRNRVEKLGGRFHRESRPGSGTSVTFTLPLNPVSP